MGESTIKSKYGIGVLDPEPIDPRCKVNSLGDITNAANYFVGMTGIEPQDQPDGKGGFIKYDIVGGTATGGWVFEPQNLNFDKELFPNNSFKDYPLYFKNNGNGSDPYGSVYWQTAPDPVIYPVCKYNVDGFPVVLEVTVPAGCRLNWGGPTCLVMPAMFSYGMWVKKVSGSLAIDNLLRVVSNQYSADYGDSVTDRVKAGENGWEFNYKVGATKASYAVTPTFAFIYKTLDNRAEVDDLVMQFAFPTMNNGAGLFNVIDKESMSLAKQADKFAKQIMDAQTQFSPLNISNPQRITKQTQSSAYTDDSLFCQFHTTGGNGASTAEIVKADLVGSAVKLTTPIGNRINIYTQPYTFPEPLGKNTKFTFGFFFKQVEGVAANIGVTLNFAGAASMAGANTYITYKGWTFIYFQGSSTSGQEGATSCTLYSNINNTSGTDQRAYLIGSPFVFYGNNTPQPEEILKRFTTSNEVYREDDTALETTLKNWEGKKINEKLDAQKLNISVPKIIDSFTLDNSDATKLWVNKHTGGAANLAEIVDSFIGKAVKITVPVDCRTNLYTQLYNFPAALKAGETAFTAGYFVKQLEGSVATLGGLTVQSNDGSSSAGTSVDVPLGNGWYMRYTQVDITGWEGDTGLKIYSSFSNIGGTDQRTHIWGAPFIFYGTVVPNPYDIIAGLSANQINRTSNKSVEDSLVELENKDFKVFNRGQKLKHTLFSLLSGISSATNANAMNRFDRPIIIFEQGDSVTNLLWMKNYGLAGSTSGAFQFEGLDQYFPYANFYVFTGGVGSHYAEQLKRMMDHSALTCSPDMLFLNTFWNDAVGDAKDGNFRYWYGVEEWIIKAKATGADVFLETPNLAPGMKLKDRASSNGWKILNALAAKYDVGIFDKQRLMYEELIKRGWTVDEINCEAEGNTSTDNRFIDEGIYTVSDQIHPTDEGRRFMAMVWMSLFPDLRSFETDYNFSGINEGWYKRFPLLQAEWAINIPDANVKHPNGFTTLLNQWQKYTHDVQTFWDLLRTVNDTADGEKIQFTMDSEKVWINYMRRYNGALATVTVNGVAPSTFSKCIMLRPEVDANNAWVADGVRERESMIKRVLHHWRTPEEITITMTDDNNYSVAGSVTGAMGVGALDTDFMFTSGNDWIRIVSKDWESAANIKTGDKFYLHFYNAAAIPEYLGDNWGNNRTLPLFSVSDTVMDTYFVAVEWLSETTFSITRLKRRPKNTESIVDVTDVVMEAGIDVSLGAYAGTIFSISAREATHLNGVAAKTGKIYYYLVNRQWADTINLIDTGATAAGKVQICNNAPRGNNIIELTKSGTGYLYLDSFEGRGAQL